MKKTLLSIMAVSALGIAGTKAQSPITLTSVDLAYVGKEIKQASDTIPDASITPGTAGTNQTWSFGLLAQHTVDTLVFTNPNWTAAGNDFPGSTVAVQDANGAYIYINNSFAGATVLGFSADIGTGNPVSIKSTPPEIMMNWPSSYNSNFSQNFESKATFYYGQDPGIGFTVDSVRIKQTVTKIDSIDAWGSVTTPLGTYNTLRVKDWRRSIDSVDIYIAAFGGWMPAQQTDDTTMMYQWWTNGIGFPLVEMDVTLTGDTVTGARWLKAIPSNTSINEHAVEVKAYPNPATDAVTFEMGIAEAAFITIYDAAGRLLESVNVTGKTTVINTSALATGSYMYTITGTNGKTLSRGNFNVVK